MAFTAAKDSGRAMWMEYTPPTPPLTPKKNQLLKPVPSWQRPHFESSKNHSEEWPVKKEECGVKPMQSKPKDYLTADSIVAKRFPAAPATITVPPTHLLSSQDSELNTMADEEEPIRTFKLQDPPKGRIKSVPRKFSDCDETDSIFQPSEQISPSRAKCQTSITQYMFPTSQQPQNGASKAKVPSSPHPSSYKIAQSPCTPSKRARSSDLTDDENLFVFPSLPRSSVVRIPTSPPASSSPNWKKYRKRSIDDHVFSDTEVADDFLDLNMSSPSPVEPIFYGRGRGSDEAVDVSPRLEKNVDYRSRTHFHEHKQVEKDASVPVRYERHSCEETSPHNCHLHKAYSTSVCHQDISSCCGVHYYESVGVDQDPNCMPYPLTPVKREEVDAESYFDAVSCSKKTKAKNGPSIIHDKMCQEPCKQKLPYKWLRPFKHSVSELVPSEFLHEPDRAVPESFPFVSTFKSAYDEQGVYRRDDSCCGWPTKEDGSPGKILSRRVSNKESIREREYLHDERYWIYMKNCTKDYAAAAGLTMPPHPEEVPSSSTRTPTSTCSIHSDSQVFAQNNRVPSQHPSPSATHVQRSPTSLKATPSPLKSPCFPISPSTKLQQFHISKSPMPEKYLETSRNSSIFLEHYATESNSIHRRKSPLPSPSAPNMKTFIFPSKHCQRSHSSPSSTWPSPSLSSSFHSRFPYRTSASSTTWQEEEHHRISSGLARRRLFCKSDAPLETMVSPENDEPGKVLHCCHCVDPSHLMSYNSVDSMPTLERTANRFIAGHRDETREPCECYERALSNQSYKTCRCLQKPHIPGMYAYRDDLEHDNAYTV